MNLFTAIQSLESEIISENAEIIEDANTYSFYTKIDVNLLKQFKKLNFESIYDYLGDSLIINIALENQQSTVFSANKGINFLMEEIDQYIDSQEDVYISIKINKEQLVKKIVPSEILDIYFVKLFSSTDNFCDYLVNNTVQYIELTTFKQRTKEIFIISDIHEFNSNNIIILVGEDLLKTSFPKIPLDNSSSLSLFSNFEEKVLLRNKSAKLDYKTEFITPDYFYFENLKTTSIKLAFQLNLIESILIFIADITKESNEKYICQFDGYKTTSIILEKNTEVNMEDLKIDILFSLYKWVYESCLADKIMISRNVISKYLKDDDSINYNILIKNIDEISNVIKSNYSVFFQEKIDSFFDDRKKVAQYTFEKSNQIEKEISSLTDSMTKNIIAAIGVIIAAIISNSNKQGLNTSSIKIVVAAYGIYLLISICYHIIPSCISITQLNKSNSHLIKYYTAFLPEEEVIKIQGTVLRNKYVCFWVYWSFSFLLILLLFVGSIYCLNNLSLISKFL